jgi:hypothetical protein
VTTALRGLEILKPVVGENDVRNVDVTAAEKLVENEEGGPLRVRHAEVLKSVGDLKGLVGTDEEAAERATTLRLASARDTAMAKVGSPLLRELYERASAVVKDAKWPDPNQCPVCDTKLTTNLSDHLQQRIAQYATADEANNRLEAAIERAASIARLGRLETAAALAVPAAERVHGPIVQAAGDHTLPTTDLDKAFARLDDLEAKRAKTVEQLEIERADIERKLPPSLVAVSRMLAAVKQFCEAISSHASHFKRLPITSLVDQNMKEK